MDTGPALVSILRQGPYLIASIHTALDDSQLVRFQRDLIDRIGEHRSRGVIIDVAALDVLDSFGSRTLRNIAEMARLRGAVTDDRRDPARCGLRDGGARAWTPERSTRPSISRRLWRTWPSRRGVPGQPTRREPMNTTDAVRRDYRVAFLRYLPSRDEKAAARRLRARTPRGGRRHQHSRAVEDPPRSVPAGAVGNPARRDRRRRQTPRPSSSSRCWRPTT